jgi:gliding motility-associated-like protein
MYAPCGWIAKGIPYRTVENYPEPGEMEAGNGRIFPPDAGKEGVHLMPMQPSGAKTMDRPALMNPRLLALSAAVLPGLLLAQMPAKCLEIESILVDACVSSADCPASTEGMNEMVRFITGPAPVALGDLQFEFYSSAFLGIAQTAETAQITAQLNAGILGCGQLLEPPAGSIPPGSRVIFVTSTALCVQANSFADLNDTLFIIYQVAGNDQGHFKNNDLVGSPITSVPGPALPRWLRITVAGTGCGDTAMYDANALVNIYGSYGGTTAENDGAAVDFTWPGDPLDSYHNSGCQAPFNATVPQITSAPGTLFCGQATALQALVAGPYTAVHWQGGSGLFSDPAQGATNYLPGPGDQGSVQILFCAVTPCGDTLCDTLTVLVDNSGITAFAGTDTTVCPGGEALLQAAATGGSPGYSFTWLPEGPLVMPEETTVYALVATDANGCLSDTALVTVQVADDPAICLGADSLFVPNVFTPNGDGKNDLFRVVGMQRMELTIFNRYGQLVATLGLPAQSWDGRSAAGETAPEGTYFFKLHGTDNGGLPVDRSGSLSLLR